MLAVGLITLIVFPLVIFAQPGLTEMGQARSFIRDSFFSVLDLSYVIAALIALSGAVVVYNKWQMGKDVGMDIPAWFFSSIFVLLTGAFLSKLLGI
jgi:hypothetical protein